MELRAPNGMVPRLQHGYEIDPVLVLVCRENPPKVIQAFLLEEIRGYTLLVVVDRGLFSGQDFVGISRHCFAHPTILELLDIDLVAKEKCDFEELRVEIDDILLGPWLHHGSSNLP